MKVEVLTKSGESDMKQLNIYLSINLIVSIFIVDVTLLFIIYY